MFDTIGSLPLHPLVVHGVVVLLPLMALVTATMAFRVSWHKAALPVMLADLAVVVISGVAAESGEKLQERLSALRGGAEVAAKHGEQAELLPWLALAVAAGAALVWLAGRQPVLLPVAKVVALVAALGAVIWTVVVGHSGATDVWSSVVSARA